MTTVELEQQRLLIGGEWVAGHGRRDLRARRPVHRRDGHGGRRRPGARTPAARATPPAAAFHGWAATPPGERRRLLVAARPTC